MDKLNWYLQTSFILSHFKNSCTCFLLVYKCSLKQDAADLLPAISVGQPHYQPYSWKDIDVPKGKTQRQKHDNNEEKEAEEAAEDRADK